MIDYEKMYVDIMDLNFDTNAANCPEDREHQVEAYLAGELSDSEKAAFEEHFFSCSVCFEAVQFRQTYKSFIKDEARQQLPELVNEFAVSKDPVESAADSSPKPTILEMPPTLENQSGSSMWPYLRIAAIVVLICGLGYFWTTSSISKTPFTPNSGLEQAMNGDVRSGKHLTVYSPQIGEEMDGQISFTWSGNDSDTQLPDLQLTVLDNNENLIHEARVSGGKYHLDKELAPGLYYWELASLGEDFESGQTLFLGKFTVVRPE